MLQTNTMQEEFETVVAERLYLLKRIFVEDLPLTYHIHVDHNDGKHIVFRMRQEPKQWRIVPQFLPQYIIKAQAALRAAIEANEAAD